MPKKAKELAEVSIRRLTHTTSSSGQPYKAVHAVGGVPGLYLQCLPPIDSESAGSKQWLYRAMIGGKRRWIGLGGYPAIPTKNAREAARALQEDIKSGIDPVVAKAQVKSKLDEDQGKAVTFKQYAARYIINKSDEYKSAKQGQRLIAQLETYAYPYIGNILVENIQIQHLREMLDNCYYEVTHTALRVLGHVRQIIQQAIIEGIRKDHNPAIWQGNLSLLYPAPNKIAPVKHREALDWNQLPEFMQALDRYNTPRGTRPDGACLAFMILTVSRPAEARLMDWKDLDLEHKVWTIPPSLLKGDDGRKSKLEWKIPLTNAALKILKEQPSRTGLVFTTLKGERIPDSYFGSNINSALGFKGEAHGFRATFRTWGQEQQRFSEEALELCLKHVDTDATRAAYARSQLFDERKKILNAYASWISNEHNDRSQR